MRHAKGVVGGMSRVVTYTEEVPFINTIKWVVGAKYVEEIEDDDTEDVPAQTVSTMVVVTQPGPGEAVGITDGPGAVMDTADAVRVT